MPNPPGDRELPLRITVLHPPAGVDFRLQQRREELVPPVRQTEAEIHFEFTLRVRAAGDGSPVLNGAAAQGPPAGRFVYVNSGTRAGQKGSCWNRRAKVPLATLGWELIEAVLEAPGRVLEARIYGAARDGGPACATVPILGGGWRLTDAN
jgi:hypothetical protein